MGARPGRRSRSLLGQDLHVLEPPLCTSPCAAPSMSIEAHDVSTRKLRLGRGGDFPEVIKLQRAFEM